MQLLTLACNLGIYALMALIVLAALAVVFLRNIFHAALALAVLLLGVAAIYLSLQAEFIGMVQILIYVGAVMTLIAFAIMLTENINDKHVKSMNRQNPIAAIGILAFLIILIRVFLKTPWPIKSDVASSTVSTFDLGKALMGTYVFPFEVISVILLAALIGAIVIARKDQEP